MRVEIELQEELTEPYVKIFTREIDEQIRELSQRISSSGIRNDIMMLWYKEKYHLVKLEDIQMIRYEDQQVMFYTGNQTYTSSQRLYQVEESLSQTFLRISKTTIISMKHVESVEPSFNSTMKVKMSNSMKDYISRKYLPGFKKYLGL